MSCPRCRGNATVVVYPLEPRALVRCARCGLVRVSPMPGREDVLRQYDADYFNDPDRGYVDYLAHEAVFRQEFRRRLRTITTAAPRGRLLDVGCATGALMLEAQDFGYSVSGLEPSGETAALARERTGAPVRARPIEDAILDRYWYDVITLFDVLEHTVDPVAVLRALRGGIKPGGVLAVTVPDFGGWWSRVTRSRWPFVTPWEHLIYFTKRTLAATLRDAGFDSVTFHGARTPLSFGTLAHHVGSLGALVPAAAHPSGFALPFGTLFALARPAR